VIGLLAIAPYPTYLISHWQLADGTDIIIRPIRPEDAELDQRFVRGLSKESRYFRFMDAMHELPETLLASLTQIDYGREKMALIAVTQDGVEQAVVSSAAISIRGRPRKRIAKYVKAARKRKSSDKALEWRRRGSWPHPVAVRH
jgi:hypothetical protein